MPDMLEVIFYEQRSLATKWGKQASRVADARKNGFLEAPIIPAYPYAQGDGLHCNSTRCLPIHFHSWADVPRNARNAPCPQPAGIIPRLGAPVCDMT